MSVGYKSGNAELDIWGENPWTANEIQDDIFPKSGNAELDIWGENPWTANEIQDDIFPLKRI